jgi:hypothetical protein
MKSSLIFWCVLIVAGIGISAASARAQSVASAAQAAAANPIARACGPSNQEFNVKSANDANYNPAAAPGKALVYFLQDDRFYADRPRPTVKWGIDGAWAGATQSDALIAISVDPGEHHVCSSWQGSGESALAHFTAEAGKTYYFRAQDIDMDRRAWTTPGILLALIDSDEGALMASQLRVSTFKLKD